MKAIHEKLEPKERAIKGLMTFKELLEQEGREYNPESMLELFRNAGPALKDISGTDELFTLTRP